MEPTRLQQDAAKAGVYAELAEAQAREALGKRKAAKEAARKAKAVFKLARKAQKDARKAAKAARREAERARAEAVRLAKRLADAREHAAASPVAAD